MPTTGRPQQTLARDAEVSGISYLSGLDVRLRFRPAPAGSGVTFVRVDLPDRPVVPATVAHVVPRRRRTAIERGGATVEMVEHVMAALSGLRVDNCTVEIDGPEAPGVDGSSRPYVEAIDGAGIVGQGVERPSLRIVTPITVREGEASLSAYPADGPGLYLSYRLDYGPGSPIGRQSRSLDLDPTSFRDDLAASRTFLLEAEALAMRRAGVGMRITERDLLIFGPDGPIDNELRFPDECVRHKLLDLVGDLALAGVDLVGHVVASRSGHSLNAELVRKLLAAAEEAATPAVAGMIGPPRDVAAIMARLPHRYPFLLVDRVEVWEPPRRIVALKNVTCNEPFFQGHWPQRPVMPGVLIVEALAQAAGLLIGTRPESAGMLGLIAAIDGVKIRRAVVPGDQLRLEVEMKRHKARSCEVRAIARVEGAVAAEARLRFVLVPAVAESATA